MKKETGGNAFPVPGLQHDADFNGMTLRDYFAAKAMQTILIGANLPTKDSRDEWFPILSEISYDVSDAMLAEREK